MSFFAGLVALIPSKVQAILKWPIPKNIKGLHILLCLLGFYCNFFLQLCRNCNPSDYLVKEGQFWLVLRGSNFLWGFKVCLAQCSYFSITVVPFFAMGQIPLQYICTFCYWLFSLSGHIWKATFFHSCLHCWFILCHSLWFNPYLSQWKSLHSFASIFLKLKITWKNRLIDIVMRLTFQRDHELMSSYNLIVKLPFL